ncbi:MAG TPA: anhydro-N-acetylmuramic acid kinase [Candidatus Krumholzibacteria bacterium]|nr:anhydro-N-acetylmuramic acid kinase [Candidatus Krumholzibacteria bacterium]
MSNHVWPSLVGKDHFTCVGLMSGTSMDGVDAALVAMSASPEHPRVELLEFVSLPYPGSLRESLADLAGGAAVTAEEVALLSTGVAVAFAGGFFDVCRRAGKEPRVIDFVGSHGQTVAHVPPGSGSPVAGTLQIGSPAMIAALTGVTTVGDFRSGDVAIGGQGAPLAPYCDYMLRRSSTASRVILNIGGISNLTYLRKGGSRESVIAFDAGPGNMVADTLFRALFPGHGAYDEDGVRAGAGTVSRDVVERLMRHPYFGASPPKSAGHREFGPPFAWALKTAADAENASPEDVLATAVALTVESIVDAMRRFLPEGGVDEVFVTGGGARNRAMLASLEVALAPVAVRPVDELGIPAEAKEAVDFAFLAREALLGRRNVLRAVTGASRELVLGTIARGSQ